MIQIFDFDKNHVEEAQYLAISMYNEERVAVAALPALDNIPDLAWFAENNKGVAAFENGKMVGYLCAWGPFDNAFGCNPNTKGGVVTGTG